MRSDCQPARRCTLAVLLALACGSDSAVATRTGGGSTTALDTSSTGEPCDEEHQGDLRIDETTDLAMIRRIRSVRGNVEIIGVQSRDLEFLGCLEQVYGDLVIAGNPALETLEGADRLVAIHEGDMPGQFGSLNIVNNPVLRSLAGLDHLQTVEWIGIASNDLLASIGLRALERVEYDWRFGDCGPTGSGQPSDGLGSNPMLTGFDGLDSLRYAPLTIYGQEHLRSLSRLRELAEGGTDFTAEFQVGINPELPQDEIDSFVAAAGFQIVVACQNNEETELCICSPD